MASEIKVDTISEKTSANGVSIDGLTVKDGGLVGDVTFADGAYDFDVASHDTSNGLKLGGTLVTATAAELNIMDGVTTTAAEINLIDGGTSRGTTALADGDGILINDAGTMRMTNVTTVKTYMATAALAGIDDQTSSNDDQLTITDTAVIINEDSDDLDFRVEGNGNTHAIFLNADSDEFVSFMKSNNSGLTAGIHIDSTGQLGVTADNTDVITVTRLTGDGELVRWYTDSTKDGAISVSGSTVSYGTFCGTHWSRLADNSQPTILRGTVMESIATMMDWYQVQFTVPEVITGVDKDGNNEVEAAYTEGVSYVLKEGESVGDIITYNHKGTDYQATIVKEDNEQLPMCKISDTADSKAVYGVFMNWDNEPSDGVNDINVAALGAFVVRVHSGETVAIGDYLQSNGDGTAKVQADDIMRASTVAKVTSTTKTITHADGSYCVPCTLHCG